MSVAALYDIHGNLPALEAVLDDIREEGVDLVVIGGDVVPGPMPRETLERLKGLGDTARFLHGNGERDVLTGMVEGDLSHLPEQAREIIGWAAKELRSDKAFLETWPSTLELQLPGLGRVLFCHATPNSTTAVFTELTPADLLVEVFAEVDADVVVCGHTHMQFDRTIGSLRVVNAGSVGMPFGEPGAHWLLLESNIVFRQTQYDLVAAGRRIESAEYPYRREFVVQYVLERPSKQEMLAVFANAEIG